MVSKNKSKFMCPMMFVSFEMEETVYKGTNTVLKKKERKNIIKIATSIDMNPRNYKKKNGSTCQQINWDLLLCHSHAITYSHLKKKKKKNPNSTVSFILQ